MTDTENTLTAQEVAQILRVSKVFVYQLMTKGELSFVQIGRCRRVPKSDLAAFMERNRQPTKANHKHR